MGASLQGTRAILHRLALMAWWLAPTSRWRTAMLERMARPNPSSAVASEDKDKPRERLGFVLCYLISTLAPASSIFFLMASASALLMPS